MIPPPWHFSENAQGLEDTAIPQELMAVLGKMVDDKFEPHQLVSLVNRAFKEEDFNEVCLLQNVLS